MNKHKVARKILRVVARLLNAGNLEEEIKKRYPGMSEEELMRDEEADENPIRSRPKKGPRKKPEDKE